MRLAKWFSMLAAIFLLLGLVAVVGAAPPSDSAPSGIAIAKSTITLVDRPSDAGAGNGGDKTPPTVEITEPTPGEVSGSVTITATATDDSGIKKVEYAVGDAGWTEMGSIGGDTYQATWDSTSVTNGEQTITVRARDNRNNKGEDWVTVTVNNPGGPLPPPPPEEWNYELFIEIDWMTGHDPTPDVLGYIEEYFMGNNPSGELINVTFHIDQEVALDPSVSDADFWQIEQAYNNLGDDKYTGKPANFKSKWKWVLFGTTVEGEPDVVGYTYVWTGGTDMLAGNYIFIADQAADDWADDASVLPYGAEAVVLMHEMGHSIGIGKLDRFFGQLYEIYDPDMQSVMSYLSVNNATKYDAWYYSADYWDTRNLEYYSVS